MPAYPELFAHLKQSGLFVDKTFLVFFGSWKLKATGEPLLYGTQYLGCGLATATALFERQDFAGLLTHISSQSHLHFETRFVASGEVVAFQLLDTGPPENGAPATPPRIYQGAEGKAVLGIAQHLSRPTS